MALDSNQRAKTWWTTTARQHNPQEADKLRQAMKANRNRLFDRFKELPDGGELAAVLGALTAQEYAFAHYWGFRRGYKVGQGLAKLARSSPQERAEARIADICLRHPESTTRQIFGALDEEGIPLVFRGRVHYKHAKDWFDVASEPAYEMWVSRLRGKMEHESRLESWKKIMKRHTKLRKQEK
jgi:hypothetical protein